MRNGLEDLINEIEAARDYGHDDLTGFPSADELKSARWIRVFISIPDAYDDTEIAGVFKHGDSFYAFSGGCDSTGWDCRSFFDFSTHDTRSDAMLAIPEQIRELLDRPGWT